MTNFRPFLGTTTDRRQAFLGIKAFTMHVRQDIYGMCDTHPSRRDSRFDLSNVPPTVTCVNPRCQQGGLETQNLILAYGSFEEKQFHCRGHEGSPKGRNVGDPCTNSFIVTLAIEKE